ncbi:FG-GAP repeat protein [Sphaerisporangium perillae]|uniref:FG-GAP repeat protein n=1 Tax=Sphaerisporangium perillae TaxID=2935860 RepID=UPI00200E6AD2|nr:FG-GAP repeat protein [Sphaerisporangium perillae]
MSASRASRLLAAATLVVVPLLPPPAAQAQTARATPTALSPAISAHSMSASAVPDRAVAAQAVVPARAPGKECDTAYLAVAAPYDTVDGQARAGTVTLYDGTKKAAVLSQGTHGLPGTPEPGDSFGSAVVAGDFDGDGCADLAIGASEEFAGTPVPDGADGNGIVYLLRGTANGLRAAGTLDVTRLGRSRDTDRFGAALAAGDLDGDGDDELVVGIPGLSEGGGAGIFGLKGRAASGKGTLITQATSWVAQDHLETDQFGAALAVGDFDGDGKAELAVGAPSHTIGATTSGGGLVVIADLRARQAGVYNQNSPGVPGEAEKWDSFGAALAAGDFDHDGRDDLAIGVPGEGLDAFQDGPMYGNGGVHVLYGTSRGLTAIGGEFWSRKTKGIRGKSLNTDRLGSALAAGDLNGDGDAELAIGLPGGNTVLVLPGTRTGGLTARHHVLLKGRPGHPGDLYGSSVAITRSGLTIGSPGAGRVTLIPSKPRKGSYTGLRTTGAHPLSGQSTGLFGFAVTS